MKQIQKPIRPRLMNEVSPTFLTHLARTSMPAYPTKYTQLYIYSYPSGLFVTSASAFCSAPASVVSLSSMLSHRPSPLSPADGLRSQCERMYDYHVPISLFVQLNKLCDYVTMCELARPSLRCVFSWSTKASQPQIWHP